MVELAEDSRRIGENDFTGPDTCAEGSDEIASLVRAFCTMKASTRGYIEALTEKHRMEKQLDEVRLQMLKNQINPHFLFNTLNMIASTAQIEDADTTEKMIHALSRLFRYNLKSTDSVMPLERELKVVQDYMYLQQMRFGQRIRYDTDCKPDTMEVLVPSFALQPLVENAIYHGMEFMDGDGEIRIRAWRKDKDLFMSVSDNGLGMTLEQVKRLFGDTDHVPSGRGSGIGVKNVNQRIRLYFGNGYGLEIQSEPDEGTTVTAHLPAISYEEVKKEGSNVK